jgi:hypothetical protein
MRHAPHGPSLPGQIASAVIVILVVCFAGWVVWDWDPRPLRDWFGS